MLDDGGGGGGGGGGGCNCGVISELLISVNNHPCVDV